MIKPGDEPGTSGTGILPIPVRWLVVGGAFPEQDSGRLLTFTDLGSGLDLTLAYAWTDARDETTGARLLRIPEHAGSATLGWTSDRLSGALTLRAEGDQDDAGGVRDSFVTANLNAAWQLTDDVALTARIENLADERYQQVLGYGEPGRSGYVGVRFQY